MVADGSVSIESEVVDLCSRLAPDGQGPVDSSSKLLDLGFDSLRCADLALAVEERFGLPLGDADLDLVSSVGDVASLVGRKSRAVARIPPGIGRLQGVAVVAAGWAFRWQSRLRVRGAEHVPRTGPVIIAANHRSMLDIPLMVLACPRPITFMAKDDLFRSRFLGWFLHELGGFPVRRNAADIKAIEVGIGLLERGDVLGLYPEGTRSRTGEMLPYLEGAAWMALRQGAPIVPCAVLGTERPPGSPRTFRKRVTISFGPPIAVDRETNYAGRRERAAAITSDLVAATTRLLT